jgi:hypothetical protein
VGMKIKTCRSGLRLMWPDRKTRSSSPTPSERSTWTLRDSAAGTSAAGQETARIRYPQRPGGLPRADGGENGKQIKSVLERLRADPGKIRGESLRYRPGAWMVLAGLAGESAWWVIWRQPEPGAVDVVWICPQPGPGPVPTPQKRCALNRHAFSARPP